MGRIVRASSALLAGALAFVVGTSTANALTDKAQLNCQKAIAKEGLKFVQGQLKLRQKCIDASLKAGGPATCPAPDPDDLQKLRDKLEAGLTKKCTFADTPGNLEAMGFADSLCPDPNENDGFTLADLNACIRDSHEALLTGVCNGGTNAGETCTTLADCPDQGAGTSCHGLLTLEYDPTITGPLAGTSASCQKELVKGPTKLVLATLKAVQKCRNDLLDCKIDDSVFPALTICKATGYLPESCATANEKTQQSIAKARTKAEEAIVNKCSDADVVALKACVPDQTTDVAASTCETTEHLLLTDSPGLGGTPDFMDFQYARPAACGDGRLNRIIEECDGGDDSACPGQCGVALSNFECLCENIPRQRVIEHANADLDNGWSGKSHDSGIVEGGGYTLDLFDCDGPDGSDPVCVAGPSCSNPPHSPCSPGRLQAGVTGDSICAGLGQGTCRKTRAGATGPYCENDIQRRCLTNAHCPGNATCVKVPHGAPLPLSSGGVSVCVLNIFSEDVTGTANLDTGAGAVRLRQNSITHLGPVVPQPCPVCGGFCSAETGDASPGNRTLCDDDSDCPGSFCVTDAVCSYGVNRDKPCRPDSPFGGPTELFGNPSVDCPPLPNSDISNGGLDILFNPASTSEVSLDSNFNCSVPTFGPTVCRGGTNAQRPCTTSSECPGSACAEQCFCPFVGVGLQSRPNACNAACLGGVNDGLACTDDSECDPPAGFCHSGSCRLNPSDTDSVQEGECIQGPTVSVCSVSRHKTCDQNGNADCAPPNCTFCEPGETCVTTNQQCFLNGRIEREGQEGTPERVSAAIFCIAGTGTPSVDGVAGLPGPGAITQPATVVETGF